MTLYQVIEQMKAVAQAQPSVHHVVENDIYKLNANPALQYGCFCYTQGQHSGSTESDYRTFNFTLYYVDRLTEDEGNANEVISTGVETLGNILDTLAEGAFEVGDYSIQPFFQRFADECAGCYVTVGVEALKGGVCAENFE